RPRKAFASAASSARWSPNPIPQGGPGIIDRAARGSLCAISCRLVADVNTIARPPMIQIPPRPFSRGPLNSNARKALEPVEKEGSRLEEPGAHVDGRGPADTLEVELQPALGARPTHIAKMGQEVPIGVEFAGDTEAGHDVLRLDRV